MLFVAEINPQIRAKRRNGSSREFVGDVGHETMD
jgi:hypothetical protein